MQNLVVIPAWCLLGSQLPREDRARDPGSWLSAVDHHPLLKSQEWKRFLPWLITDYYKNINTENLLIKQACVHVWVVGEGLRHPYLTVYFHSYSFEDVPLLWFLENPRYLRKVI